MYDDKFLIEQIKRVSFKSLEVFLNRINLDISLFNHLKDIKVEIGVPKTKDALAVYNPNTNTMVISRDKVNIAYKRFCKGKLSYENFIDTIALYYLHELLHENRTILIANTLSFYNYKEVIYKDNYNALYSNELKKYRQALDNVLVKYDYKKFQKYIPILVTFKANNNYDVVIYNKSNKSFEIFYNRKFDASIENSRDNFLFNISKEINQKNLIPDQIIYDYYDFDVFAALPTDYKFNKGYYEFGNNKHYRILEKSLLKQNALEEVLTEAFTLIMILTYDEDEINYDSILSNPILDENDVMGVTLIKEFDEETLRWYFLSVYDDVYYDMFMNVFKEKYKDVLNIMYKIYELKKPVTEQMLKDIKLIIKDKLKDKSK